MHKDITCAFISPFTHTARIYRPTELSYFIRSSKIYTILYKPKNSRIHNLQSQLAYIPTFKMAIYMWSHRMTEKPYNMDNKNNKFFFSKRYTRAIIFTYKKIFSYINTKQKLLKTRRVMNASSILDGAAAAQQTTPTKHVYK